MKHTPDEGFYNHREVAALFGITPDHVHTLVTQGKIPHERVPFGIAGKSRLRFKKSEIHALRDKLTTESTFGKSEHFFTGVEETGQQPRKQENEGPEWYSCDKCGSHVHSSELSRHAALHKGDED